MALAAGRAFVTDQYAGTVSVFDVDHLTVVKTLEVGDHPEGIAADGSGSVYFALWGDDELVKIDAVKLEVVARTRVGSGPRAFGEFLR